MSLFTPTFLRAARRWGSLLALAFLFVMALGVRRAVLESQIPDWWKRPLPFTLEGALQFRLAREVYLNGHLPAVDPAIEHPAGIRTWATDTVGAEYVYASLARLFPAGMELTHRIRWIECAWFSMGIPLLALAIFAMTRNRLAAFLGALFYAVAISSVSRSTGQEISHENFALPLWIAHIGLFAWLERDGARLSAERRRGLALGSGLTLALALLSWDLIQYYLLFWTARHAAVVFQRNRADPVRGIRLSAIRIEWIGLAAAALLHPYFRSHGFLLSPLMTLNAGLAALAIFERRAGATTGWPVRLLFLAAPPAVGLALSGAYSASYGHFAELLWAKIRFLNDKPADPALLTFNQRIMWTPALHSIERFSDVLRIFPFAIWLTFAGSVVFFLRKQFDEEVQNSQAKFFVVFHAASFAGFLLFVRLHVFTAVTLSIVFGWCLAAAGRARLRWAVPVVALAVLTITAEAAHTLIKRDRWGRANVYYDQLVELGEWLRTRVSPRPVLANFGVSAFILTYGQCPILLHPKFESPSIRNRVREYGEHLFRGTEESFRDWAEDNGAQYFVYSLGEFAPKQAENQMRYMVDALQPPETAPAHRFETAPKSMSLFRFEWGNAKYRVFRIVRKDDLERARGLSAYAEKALQEGDLDRALKLAGQALEADSRNERALQVIRHAASLKDQGFQSGPPGNAPK